MSEISFNDFVQVEMHVGRVISASEPEWSHKLIEQIVDFGDEMGQRTIYSGLRSWYSADDFTDRCFVYVTNLAPKKMGDAHFSQGMILAVEDRNGTPIRWELEGVAPGTRVG